MAFDVSACATDIVDEILEELGPSDLDEDDTDSLCDTLHEMIVGIINDHMETEKERN